MSICLFTIFEKVFEEDIDPVSYIEEHGLKIVEDTGLLNDTLQTNEHKYIYISVSLSVSVSVSGFFGSENNRSVIRFLF